MANTTKKKTQTKAPKVVLDDIIVESTEPTEINLEKTTPGVVKIEDYALINVKSNVFGELFFVDPVTKEEISWEQCGTVLQLPLSTLRHMKTGAIKFFSNQLIVITGFADENADKYETADIYKTLAIGQYYKNYVDPANYEEICSWTEKEIEEKVSIMSQSARLKLVVVLNTYIQKGILDSLKSIKSFEKALGCELSRPE